MGCIITALITFLFLCSFCQPAFGLGADADIPGGGHGHRGPAGTNYFNVAVPAHPYDLILARPETHSVTLSLLAYHDVEGFVAYGKSATSLTNQTPARRFKSNAPAELVLNSLSADTEYFYQLSLRQDSSAGFISGPVFAFHTARPPGSRFSFTLTADAHLDEHTSPEVFEQTLANIRAEQPDFHIDLGNLFMTDKHATRAEAARQYLAQRFYLGQISSSVPLFLALGVHDGESSRYEDGSAGCLAVWSNLMRRHYFPDPIPDGFYTGNDVPKPYRGLPADYFAWTWGDALFVVLDPYGFSVQGRGGHGDGWGWSLGRRQYDWLAQTLARSPARYKFIFLHNLLSGDQASRGGVEIAPFNEWGGRNADGSDGWAQHRPGWAMPIHPLLLRNRVTAVFRAHDNFYARQELDGLPYLMVPQPSFAGDDRIRDLENYGYKQGVFLGNSGHVQVTVAPESVTVNYVKSGPERRVADHFVIKGQ